MRCKALKTHPCYPQNNSSTVGSGFVHREQIGARIRPVQTEVTIRSRGRHAPARRPLDKAFLDQIRFVNLLDRTRILAHGYGKVREPGRSALKLFDERHQDPRIHVVETMLIHIKCVQRPVGDSFRDAAISFHFREIPRSSQ